MSTITLRLGIVAALLSAGSDICAMTLSGRGLGQVLIFPYYTVNANQNTVMTLINSTSDIKAVKVRFREAQNGRGVASFNVYLSPFDVWTGGVFLDDDTVSIGTYDNSCTAPSFSTIAKSANIPVLPFSTDSFVGANSDGGPTDSTRLYEGNVEVFEMGVVANDGNAFSQDIYHVDSVPPGCKDIAAAWETGGAWATDPTKNMLPPNGGLYGSSGIVNVAEGTFFEVMPSVLDGFSTSEQNSAPNSVAPDFNTASAGADGKVAASVDIGTTVLTTHFSKSVDAVSAMLMQTRSMNEYVTFTGSQETDWVATFPTKRFYVDPALNPSTDAPRPFDTLFGAVTPFDGEDAPSVGSCVPIDLTFYDREENQSTAIGCGPSPCTFYILRSFCHETSVVRLTYSESALKTQLHEGYNGGTISTTGHLSFNFANVATHTLTSDDGYTFTGLPTIGFVAENYINANVTPGVLANYSSTVPHRSTLQFSGPP